MPLPRTALPHEVLRASLEAIELGRRLVVATVIARHGSTPSTPGQKLMLVDDGSALGTVGGGAVERGVLAAMAAMLADPSSTPRVDSFRLGPELGMCCGGSVDVLIEPITPPVHVLVVGGGHVGVFVAPLLAGLGFRVTLCDAREEAADPTRLAPPAGSQLAALPDSALEIGHAPAPPTAPVELVHGDHDDPEVLRGFTKNLGAAAVLVMTHDHQLDQAAVEWAIRLGFGFVGGVGSRAKAARTRARLQAKGFSEEDVARVRMPVGTHIHARTPAEIGVSIAGELIAWRAMRFTVHAGQRLTPAAPDGAAGAERSGDP